LQFLTSYFMQPIGYSSTMGGNVLPFAVENEFQFNYKS
jgi:hypothetical protein